MSLDNTAATTETPFDYASRLRDLDEAVLLARQSLALHPLPDLLHHESLDNLAGALSTRFYDGGQRGDLDEAILLYQEALELRPSPDPLRPDSLNNLSKVLLKRFVGGGQASDLNEAISLPKQALELQSLTDPNRSRSLHNLALSLWIKSTTTGSQLELNESISLHQQALELRALPHPLRSDSLDGLGKALFTRFELEGDQNDLKRAISLHRQALELRPSPHPDRSVSLHNLAIALNRQFGRGGHQPDLDEAILRHRQALELRPASQPLRSTSLFCLAFALLTRFQEGGHQSDLDEAILLHRQALELQPSPHPLRPASLDHLASALTTRFEQEGHQSDLYEAISLQREALTFDHRPRLLHSTSLNNLAVSLIARFEKEGRLSDLNEAISLQREALSLQTLSQPQRFITLYNLANSLQTRFDQDGHQSDLTEAISLQREALSHQSVSHPHRSQWFNNLANALRAKFENEGQKTDLNEAILLYRQALELRTSPHPAQSQSLHDLGKALLHAHLLTGNNSDYLEEAMKLFSAGTQCLNQPASLRLRIANTWIKHAVSSRHMSAIDAYDAALQSLPKLGALSFDVESRQKALLTAGDGLVRDAARFAIQAGRTDKAVEFLEAGRAVFWSQFLSLRSPLNQLREILPELADKLRDSATALELGSHRNKVADASENQQKLVRDQETARLNRLNEEWLNAINDVRQLTGFENFLRSRSFSELQVAASAAPVVILIGNDDGSDILILTSANVRAIHLSGLPTTELQKLVHLIHTASSHSSLSRIEDFPGNDKDGFSATIVETLRSWTKLEDERGISRKRPISSDDIFRSVLKTLWNVVVKPVIDVLDLKTSERPPVVQWCPTGLFSFLPIHAAGCYDTLAVQCASDYFISSYTPTIGALLTQDHTPSAEPFNMMVVIQSQELQATRTELENIEKYVSDNSLVKLGIPGASAFVEAVASQLSDVAIVHFSCHGTQDRSNPLDSGLKLEDGLLRVSRIMKEKIPNGALAFLCACETAMGDGKLPDEAMSLGASLLFSGFRRVVATMWEMHDIDGPVVADAFYKELFQGPDGKLTREPDVSKSAYALHMAVKTLRNKKVSFSRWVPFIHLGK